MEKTGEMDPGKETFKFAIERFGATTEYVLVQDTVEHVPRYVEGHGVGAGVEVHVV